MPVQPTPGWWHVSTVRGECHTVKDQRGRTLAKFEATGDMEEDANARLAAAAPALADALDSAVNLASEAIPKEAREEAEAALALAGYRGHGEAVLYRAAPQLAEALAGLLKHAVPPSDARAAWRPCLASCLCRRNAEAALKAAGVSA